jgi:hypothetical protein
VPGSAALLRELSGTRTGLAPAHVAIVSGSPSQMRKVLEKKLRLDGVRWDEFHLKPQWENLKRGRLRAIKEQVGYKLPLLLSSRARLAAGVRETLFGDDAEADAFIYTLYAECVAGRVDGRTLSRILRAAGAYGDALERCRQAIAKLETSDDVERIFIMLDGRTPPARFAAFGSRVVPVYNYFQAALVLFADGHLDVDGVIAVTTAFLEADQHHRQELANLFQDAVRRGCLPSSAMQDLGLGIQERLEGTHLEAEADVIWRCVASFTDLGGARHYRPPAPPETPDWSRLLEGISKA